MGARAGGGCGGGHTRSAVNREMQIKSHNEMPLNTHLDGYAASVGEDVESLGISNTVAEIIKWCNHS